MPSRLIALIAPTISTTFQTGTFLDDEKGYSTVASNPWNKLENVCDDDDCDLEDGRSISKLEKGSCSCSSIFPILSCCIRLSLSVRRILNAESWIYILSVVLSNFILLILLRPQIKGQLRCSSTDLGSAIVEENDG